MNTEALAALREALAKNAPYLVLRNAAASLVASLDEAAIERAEAEPARVMTLCCVGEITRTARSGSPYLEIVHFETTSHANNPLAKRDAKRILEVSPRLREARRLHGEALGIRWESRI